MIDGERQVAPTLDGIRRDHRARYEWAARQLPPETRVIDVASGVGYGAFIVAEAGHSVLAIDRDPEAIAYAREHYRHMRVLAVEGDAEGGLNLAEGFGAAICFETIEYLADPLTMLRQLAACADRLLASVPNQERFPFRGTRFHYRHYTRLEFLDLLERAGWCVTGWFGQEGRESEVEADVVGRTAIVTAEPWGDRQRSLRPIATELAPRPKGNVPDHVAILGLGPSLEHYVDTAKRLGARRKYADEVWAINAVGDVCLHDRVFHMDDVRIQEIRAAALPESNIAAMLGWLKSHPGPIYTSQPHPDYPGLVAYPLEEVINSLGFVYFNSTAAYAVALAIFLGVKSISLFGIDFTYSDPRFAEAGRACVEFWLGVAVERGIQVIPSAQSSLLDAIEDARAGGQAKLYGYDAVDMTIEDLGGGKAKVTTTPKETLPTAAEIEARYDHTRHPSPLMRATSKKD